MFWKIENIMEISDGNSIKIEYLTIFGSVVPSLFSTHDIPLSRMHLYPFAGG